MLHSKAPRYHGTGCRLQHVFATTASCGTLRAMPRHAHDADADRSTSDACTEPDIPRCGCHLTAARRQYCSAKPSAGPQLGLCCVTSPVGLSLDLQGFRVQPLHDRAPGVVAAQVALVRRRQRRPRLAFLRRSLPLLRFLLDCTLQCRIVERNVAIHEPDEHMIKNQSSCKR